jgi:hypothetical protein
MDISFFQLGKITIVYIAKIISIVCVMLMPTKLLCYWFKQYTISPIQIIHLVSKNGKFMWKQKLFETMDASGIKIKLCHWEQTQTFNYHACRTDKIVHVQLPWTQHLTLGSWLWIDTEIALTRMVHNMTTTGVIKIKHGNYIQPTMYM